MDDIGRKNDVGQSEVISTIQEADLLIREVPADELPDFPLLMQSEYAA